MAENKILSISGNALNVSTAEKKKREALIALTESQKARKILTGIVKGVEKVNGTAVAVVYYENFKIIIPAECMIEITPVQGKPEDQWPEYLLSKRLGSENNYIGKDINIEEELAVASRTEAMEIIKNERIFAKNPDNTPVFTVGSVAEARVVCSTRAGIFVEIFGVETYIRASELSYQRIQDATVNFPVGQYVLVKILSLEVDENNKVKLSASVKQAQENPYKKAMLRYQEGDKYIGTVSMVDEHGVFVALDGGVDVLCQFPKRGTRPTRGTMVTVRITTKNEEMNRIFGTITHTSSAQ